MHQRGPRRDQAGDHDPARLEPAVTGGDDRGEHPFVDPEPAEPLRDDHIDTFRRLEVCDVAVDHLDDLRDPVRGGKLLRQDGGRRPLHRVDARGTRPRREHAQDAASGPDVENDVAGAHHRLDRTPEGPGADAVADHRPVDLELRIHRVRRVPDRRPHLSIVARWVTGALASMAAWRAWIGQQIRVDVARDRERWMTAGTAPSPPGLFDGQRVSCRPGWARGRPGGAPGMSSAVPRGDARRPGGATAFATIHSCLQTSAKHWTRTSSPSPTSSSPKDLGHHHRRD